MSQNPAAQFGGNGKVGLISLQKFWAFNNELVKSPLKIQFATNSAKVISRNQGSLTEDTPNDETIQWAASHWHANTADPSIDSPPIEIRANYTTNAPASHVAEQANVGSLAESYHAAFGPGGTQDQQVAWLTSNFTKPPISPSEALAYLTKT